jgi:PadR family transcriptional regulator, regulatory protein PadR
MARETNPNFMAGVPELIILRLLQDREMYGYELVQAMRVETGDVLSFGEGVVYTVLHALEREGALKSRRRRVEGRSRIYYTLTPAGMRRYGELAGSWVTLARAIQSVIKQKALQSFIMGGRHAVV